MKKNQEIIIGLITLVLFIFALISANKLLDFFILWVMYVLVIFLWQRKSVFPKIVAVTLLPLLMFRIFLPKRTKNIIKEIEEIEKARSGAE